MPPDVTKAPPTRINSDRSESDKFVLHDVIPDHQLMENPLPTESVS